MAELLIGITQVFAYRQPEAVKARLKAQSGQRPGVTVFIGQQQQGTVGAQMTAQACQGPTVQADNRTLLQGQAQPVTGGLKTGHRRIKTDRHLSSARRFWCAKTLLQPAADAVKQRIAGGQYRHIPPLLQQRPDQRFQLRQFGQFATLSRIRHIRLNQRQLTPGTDHPTTAVKGGHSLGT